MGLFSDLFGSSSHTSTTSSTSQVTNTQLAGGGIGGNAIYGSGNQVITTDQGAVLAATDVSDHAIALGAAEIDAGKQVAFGAITANQALADHTTDAVTRFAGDAINVNAYIAGKSLDDLASAYSDSLTTIANQQQGTLNTVEGLAAQTAQSGQQATDQTVIKVVAFLAIAVVAIFVLRK